MFFLLFFSLLLSQHHCAETYNINRSQPLSQDQSLVSPGNIYVLGFFRPANLDNKYVGIWHKNISPQKVVWVANREKPIAASDTSASLIINSYGNIELVDGKQNSLWSTNISVPSNSSSAALLDTGNFVVKDDGTGAEADPLWQSFDHPSDTQLPEMVMGFDTKSGKMNVFAAWKSESDPSAGLFSTGLSQQTPSQQFIWFNNGSTPYWRSGPWDKSKFIGVPGMDNRYGSGFKLQEGDQPGTKYFSYKLSGSTLSYLELSSEGVLKQMFSDNGSDWWVHRVGPNNTYDTYGTCGVFGILQTSGSPIPNCKCMKGFAPKSDDEWSKGNSTGGCERKTNLFCRNNTNNSVASKGKEDGFWEMKMVKLPDLHKLIENMDADECKIQCLNDCACLAYAYPDNIGCLVWSNNLIDVQEFTSGGADLFIRLADAELGEEGKPIKLIVILILIGFISILVAILFGVHRLRANQRRNTKGTNFFPLSPTSQNSRDDLQEYIRKHDGSELSIYSFDSILIATNNFSIMNKLGEGGFGPVYQGKLQEGNEIAVKRLSSSSGQGVEEFKNEMLLISKLQHKNLVRIMGCCVKEDEKLLIYEFMPNRSLDTLLFDPKRIAELDWTRRFDIIQGVARGLLYLHRDSRLKVIHRDLKVSNILLDENMNAKISDFGLARIVEGTQNLNTQKVVGTLGYMSPEYAMGGIFSEKSDVYSFGVLLLEIISGRKNTSFYYNPEHLSLLAYTWHLWNGGRGLHLADKVLADSCSASEVMRCLHIGLLCVQDKAADRPTMPDVVFMLSSETVLPQAKQPIFTFQNSVSDSQPHKFDNAFSANEATITTIEGR